MRALSSRNGHSFLQFYRISSTLTYRDRVLRAFSKWEHHGMTLLTVHEHFIMLDLTAHMDCGKRDTMLRTNCRSQSGWSSLLKTIERETFLSLQRYAYKPCASVIGDLKALGIFKYRARRGGKKGKHNVSPERHPKSIQVVESHRPSKTYKQRFEHGTWFAFRRRTTLLASHPALNLQFRSASSPTSVVWQNPKIDYGLRSLSRCI